MAGLNFDGWFSSVLNQVAQWPWPTIWTAVAAVGTVLAFFSTYLSVRLTRKIIERDAAPYLRMARINVVAQSREFRITNLGRGIAMSGILVDSDGHSLCAFGHVSAGETTDINTSSKVSELPSQSYHLYYQDLSGRWHATKLVPWANRFRSRFEGPVKIKQVPKIAREEAQVISAWEALHRRSGS